MKNEIMRIIQMSIYQPSCNSVSPVSVVAVAGFGAGLRLGRREGGESESYNDLGGNQMRNLLAISFWMIERARAVVTLLDEMNSRGISCWSANESPQSATKGGNLAAFIDTKLARVRRISLFRKLAICIDDDDNMTIDAAAPLRNTPRPLLFLLVVW